jgi:hypothetical protein
VTSAATARPATAIATCYNLNFCLYQNADFGGGIERFYYCGWQKAYQGYYGSYINNQTSGTVAELNWINGHEHNKPGRQRVVRGRVLAAELAQLSLPWDPKHGQGPCQRCVSAVLAARERLRLPCRSRPAHRQSQA